MRLKHFFKGKEYIENEYAIAYRELQEKTFMHVWMQMDILLPQMMYVTICEKFH